MTTSPSDTSIGTRLPLSSTRPGPTARTLPSWGFSLAVSGMTMPDAVVVSASLACTTILSSSGLMFTLATCALPFLGVPDWIPDGIHLLGTAAAAPRRRGCRGSVTAARLALYRGECQCSTSTRRSTPTAHKSVGPHTRRIMCAAARCRVRWRRAGVHLTFVDVLLGGG